MIGLEEANNCAGQMPNQNIGSGVIAGCANSPCPTDFTVEALCRIVKSGGGSAIKITASDMPGFSGGTFTWSTSSTKIRLAGGTGSEMMVEGLADVSTGRDAEVVQVVRSGVGCGNIAKTISITVAKVTFSAAANQRYGYDNNDTPVISDDDHVSIQSEQSTTVHVVIEGGALGTDFNFVCDTPSLCTAVAPDATAIFDLILNAGITNQGHDLLHVKGKCPAAPSFTHINVCVYALRVVDVVVAKIDHPTVANRSLRFPDADYASHAPAANDKLKEGVVQYNITNYNSNNILGVAFASGTGILSYDICNGGGADLQAINSAMTGTGTSVRVAIIRDMKSYYYLDAAIASRATTLTLRNIVDNNYLKIGITYWIGEGATREELIIVTASQSSGTITCNALRYAHAIGAPVEFDAGGWGSDPILIKEGIADLDIAKWTILHEVGHNKTLGLNLLDVNDITDFMHYSQAWTDHRLRYCPRILSYNPAISENQWELIPRT